MAFEAAPHVLDELWSEVVAFIPKKEQRDTAQRIVKIFEDNCDFVAHEDSDHALLRKVSRDLNNEDQEDDDEDE